MSQAAHASLKRSVRLALEARGYKASWNVGGPEAEVGRADLTACIRGFYVDIECKTGSAHLEVEQRRYREKVLRAGGIYITARSAVGAVLQAEEAVRNRIECLRLGGI